MTPGPARPGIYRLTVDFPEELFNALEGKLDKQREQLGGANRGATMVRLVADAPRGKGYRKDAIKGRAGRKS